MFGCISGDVLGCVLSVLGCVRVFWGVGGEGVLAVLCVLSMITSVVKVKASLTY